MPWVRFAESYDWSPRYGVSIAYKAGKTYLVTTQCFKDAAGKAYRVPKPRKDDDDRRPDA